MNNTYKRRNRKTEEGDDHPDRDAQFRFITDEVRKALAAKRPVISVDTKQMERLGDDHTAGGNGARRRRRTGCQIAAFGLIQTKTVVAITRVVDPRRGSITYDHLQGATRRAPESTGRRAPEFDPLGGPLLLPLSAPS